MGEITGARPRGSQGPAIERKLTRCLLRPTDVAPRYDGFEVIGTFNPAAVALDKGVALLIRVAERPTETRSGYVALPYWDGQQQRVAIDWRSTEEVESVDPRVVRLRHSGDLRLTFLSWLLVAFSRDGVSIDRFGDVPFLPSTRYESFGVEDPRLTQLDGRFYFTYVAVSEYGVVTALASTQDFQSFERHGTIFCPENKDVVLFPDRCGGQYVALHRPGSGARFCAPEIWIAKSPDLLHWGDHQRLVGDEVGWATSKIGGGTPPVRTERGWLTLLHGNIQPKQPGGVGRYAAAAMLLDLDDPRKIVGLSSQPVMLPEADFECRGFLPDIVFPTAMVARGEDVDVYYGAADTAVGVVRYSLDDLLATV